MKKQFLSVAFFLCCIPLVSHANILHNPSVNSNKSSIISSSYQSAGVEAVNDSINPKTGKVEVYTVVDQLPQYPGGQGALLKHISNNLKYPPKAQEAGIEGLVYVRFIVTDKGKATNAEIMHLPRSVKSSLLEEEAMRVIGTLPDWIPAKNKGEIVSMYFVVPITFALKGNKAASGTSSGNAALTSPGQLQNPLIESKSLVGFWRQSIYLNRGNGNVQKITTSNFKIINADNTFFAFTNWSQENTKVGLYGTYKITSDSTYTEHIIMSGINPKMSNTDSKLRYKMINDKVLLIQYYNEVNGQWVPEYWERVTLKEPNLNGVKGI